MDEYQLNVALQRKALEYNIKEQLRSMEENKTSKTSLKGIYLYGKTGVGKSYFVRQLLDKMKYDVIYYDSGDVRNKNLIEHLSKDFVNDTNVLSMFQKKPKKRIIVMDEIDGMNMGDKLGLTSLITLLRPKKTKKQANEKMTHTLVFCIGGPHNDKKIRELMNVCHVFKMEEPPSYCVRGLLEKHIHGDKVNDEIITMLEKYINCDVRKLIQVLDIWKRHRILLHDTLMMKRLFQKTIEEKNISQVLLSLVHENTLRMRDYNHYINENDRTTLALILHENMIQLNKNDRELYKKCLQYITYGDYIDRIIFQHQIWDLSEGASMLKILPSLDMIKDSEQPIHSRMKSESDVVFTKVLTKYSNEYNNQNFIQSICNKLMVDKKDLFSMMVMWRKNKTMATIYDLCSNHEMSKLDVDRLYRYMDKII